MKKTTQEIRAEVERLEALEGNATLSMYEITFLEASKDALLWALGEREQSQSEKI